VGTDSVVTRDDDRIDGGSVLAIAAIVSPWDGAVLWRTTPNEP